jgi:uncharacterized protein
MIDLQNRSLEIVRNLLIEHIPNTPVFVFGSRANGRAKKFSDLDLLIHASHPLEFKKLAAMREAFEDSDLPITVDLVDWNACSETFRAMIAPQLVQIHI